MLQSQSLVQFMDSSELKTRDLKLESMQGYNSANEDDFQVFPNCLNCNPTLRIIWIKNKKPIVKTLMIEFPLCEKCNPNNKCISWEKEI